MINFYKVHLTLFRLCLRDKALWRILSSLGQEVISCDKAIREMASQSEDQESVDFFTDSECEVIEDLLGMAFVVCQTYITRVVHIILSLHKYHNGVAKGSSLSITGNNKDAILSFGSEHIENIGYTEVQLIDAFANYFKHRDEWSGDWNKLKHQGAKTANIIMAAGARPGSTGNLRLASELLSNREYKDTNVFINILDEWCKALYNGYSSELKQLGLI